MIETLQQGPAKISMEEAVGYPAFACAAQAKAEHALVLKHASYFLITNDHGDVAPPGHCSLGLFKDDTRILSHYALSVRGGPPSLLALQSPHSYIGQVDLTITDGEFGGNSWDPKNCVHIRRELLISDRMVEQVTLTNYLPRTISYWIELAAASDFADIFEIRGWKRTNRGQFYAPVVEPDLLAFSYEGLDGVTIRSAIRFRHAPSEISAAGAKWRLELHPKTPLKLEWEISGGSEAESRHLWSGFSFKEHREQMAGGYARWTSECSRWNTQPRDFEGILGRAVEDLSALRVQGDGSRVISAGIPWYSTVFGRDSIITSLQALPLNPAMAVDTLRYLAQHQGRRVDAFTEEEPGKIMHELRRGEMARNLEIPHLPYYGTIDATPLWLVLLHETWLWTSDRALVMEFLPHAELALQWIEKYGDKDGDGFVEYSGSSSSKGLVNQGWKDSGDGVPFPDATLPEAPISLVEVQGYVYDAYVRMASLYEAFGEDERAGTLRNKAAELRENIIRHFWIESVGAFALALDGRKNPLPTITSNAGHLLWSGVPDARQAKLMLEHLLGADMYSGWGIRTLSAAHGAYNPMSYHNGSVWPHDNAIIAAGLARYGFQQPILTILSGLHDAALCDEFNRLPELFCGTTRTPGMHPVWYPVSCIPQAWAAGAFFMLLQAALGIRPEAPANVLHIRNPQLPAFVNELTISDLVIGGSKVSLQFRRYSERTLAHLVSLSGEPLQVRIELS